MEPFAVAHFADKNQFGSLTQSGPQCEGESGSVRVKLALMNGGAFVVVEELDRILNRNDVAGLLFVDLVHESRER